MRYSLVRILFVCGVFAGVGAGCHDRLYDSGETIDLVDGGTERAPRRPAAATDVPATPAWAARSAPAATPARAARATTAATGVGGNGNACDDSSPLRQTDVANCGHVLQPVLSDERRRDLRRRAPASTPASPASSTPIATPANGCECKPTNGGVEICDGVDNDCNGVVDDVGHLTTTPKLRRLRLAFPSPATAHCDGPGHLPR